MSQREVGKEEFFKAIAHLNVHPSTNANFKGVLSSRWEMLDGSRRVVGITSEDWTVRPHGPQRYFLEEDHS